jgi:HD-GYP domain-containing protein (c-di-GMP phosphodiesterase class II)
MTSLEVVDGIDAGKRFLLGAQTYLGRVPSHARRFSNFIALSDQAVSRLHARITQQGSRFFVEDLKSTNGTILQGKALEPRMPYLLNDGDILRVCSTALRFRAERPIRSRLARPLWEQWSHALNGPATSQQPLSTSRTGTLRLVKDRQDRPEFTAVLDASSVAVLAHPQETTAKRDLAEALRRLQAMVQVSLTLGAATERADLLQRVLDVTLSIFPAAERVLVLLHERGGEAPVPAAATRRSGPWEGTEAVPVSHTIIREVLGEHHAVVWRTGMGYDVFEDPGASLAGLSPYSVMCAPLLVGDEVLGLMQVDTPHITETFGEEDLRILSGISAQLAIALKNAQHYTDIEVLFDGVIRASIRAIESRDPTTAGHSFRVAELAERLALAVDQTDRHGLADVHFSPEELKELRYTALLHDFGKIGVREHVLTKEKKLHPHQMASVKERFSLARARIEERICREVIESHLRNPLPSAEFSRLWERTQRDLTREIQRLERLQEAVERANDPDHTDTDLIPDLQAAAQYRIPGDDHAARSLLDADELACLSLATGTLSADERTQMQSHVTHTFAFLSLIPWTQPLSHIPEFAYAHHERLDGSGYPRGLTDAQLPMQAKILAIADIYDALRAGDRPYRAAMPEDKALDILRSEVVAGKLDGALIEVFVESEAYRLGEQELL